MLRWVLLFMGWQDCFVDRVEGEYAIIEWGDETFSDVPLQDLPKGCGEGSRLLYVPRLIGMEARPVRYHFKPASALECVQTGGQHD